MSNPTSISKFVLNEFEKDPSIGTVELIERVQKASKEGRVTKKDSKFSKTHVAWYKYQIRKGIYRDKVSPEMRKELSLGTPQKSLKS